MAAHAEAGIAIARHHGAGRISAIIPERFEAQGSARLQLMDAAGKPLGEPVFAGVRGMGDHSRLRARIDPYLQPGTYDAELVAEGAVRRISVVIDPLVSLRVDPPTLRLVGNPGAAMQTSIVIANVGNIPAHLPDHGAVGVYEVNGVETAIGRAYRSDTENAMETLNRFIKELRRGYGGLIRLRLEGVQPLRPGQACSVAIIATPSERLRAGHVYTGVWPLENLNYAVRVEVGGERSPEGAGQQ